MGAVLQAKGDLEAAVVDYRGAIELDPKYPAPRSNLGVILLKARRVNEAIEHLEVACQYHPKDVGSLYTLGAAYAEARRLNDAMTTFEKVISLSPDHGGAKIAQVKVLILMGDPDAADDLAAKAIAQQGLRPNEVEALVKLRQLIRESRKNQSTPK